MFKGRKLLIATKHRKEEVLAPLLQETLGVSCFVPENFDTDQLGTFSGEVERSADPFTTVRRKCELAMEQTGCDLAVASEGSFGPGPATGFVLVGDEILMLVDKKHGLEITARKIFLETNFAGAEVETEKQLLDFAEKVKFPTHALILRPSHTGTDGMVKGITDKTRLLRDFEQLKQEHKMVFVETDMRAMYNPTRMESLKQLASLLLQKIETCCPACNIPGFDITSVKHGLPCGLCSFPTQSVLSTTSTCQKCGYAKEQLYPRNKHTEDPGFCQLCNP